MSDRTQITGVVPIYPTIDMKVHDLTILYLKHQNLENISTSEIAQKYIDVSKEFVNLLK